MKTILYVILVFGAAVSSTAAWAVDATEKADKSEKAEKAERVEKAEKVDKEVLQPRDLYPKALDGVLVEAVENYPNPKNNEIGFALGVFPFNTYYTGFSLSGDYVYYFNKTWAWEIINAAVAFNVQTDVTTQLADKYNVNPNQISMLNLVASSNLLYVFTHGKVLVVDRFIRYFRASVLGGIGFANSTMDTGAGVNVGIRIDAYVNESFSWKLEFRDMITVTSGVQNFGSFTLGTGIAF